MQQLDLFTVRVMTLMTVLISGIATLFAWKINRSVGGMRLFALGMMSMGLGSAVGIAGAAIPGNAVVIAGTAFRFAGMICLVQGFRAFRGIPPLNRAGVITLATTVSVLFLYWLLVRDLEGMRLGVLSSALALLAVDAAHTMLRRVPMRDRPTCWPIGLVFAFIAVALALRAVTALSGASHGGMLSGASPGTLLSPVPIEIVWTVCANIAFVVCAFGMLLASNSQLRYKAEDLAFYDALTNLPNRRFFQDRLLKAEQTARAAHSRFGVIYLDLDGFKLVNDTLGHDAGDDVLKNVSAAIAGIAGPGDCAARVGGDEFVVLIEDFVDRSELTEIAERLTSSVARATVSGNLTGEMRVSCGVAVFPDDGLSAHDVLREADIGMFRSKRRSRVAGHSRTA